MGLIAKDLPALIFLLLPGFISAGVFYTLTAHPKASEFERLIQSLIFTAFVRVGVNNIKSPLFFIGKKWRSYGPWTEAVEFDWSVLLAITLGLFFALMANHDWFHLVMRKLNVSNRTSFPSEWYGSFKHCRSRVVLHLKGERRLGGWPYEWPDQSDKGHFVIQEPAWILDDESIAPVYEDELILVPAADVEMVEFLKWPAEITASPEQVSRSRRLLAEARAKKKENDDGSEGTPESP